VIKKIKLEAFRVVMKQAIKVGGFILGGKPYVILTDDEFHELNNKSLAYERIKEFVSK
jgi:non-homologous end joining protein Ku